MDITDNAKEKLAEVLEQVANKDKFLRVIMEGFG